MRYELTGLPLVKALLKNRWPQFMVFAAMLAGFLFAILAGLIGTPVGSHNFGIVFTWIAWWAILILVAVPFFGRGWCAVCPIPLPGEWIQRGGLLAPTGNIVPMPLREKLPWLLLRWPKKLRNIWLQNASFTLVALFSSVILTTPQVTAVVLGAMIFVAIGLSMVFERRAFCRYLCPVGGFIGLYAQVAPLELRVKDKQVCATCTDKFCYKGSVTGYGCPWGVFPDTLSKNTYCGLCMECLRTCPNDNIAINARPFSADLAKPSTRMDEAFKAFIMLGAAMIYAGVLLGPWGSLKMAAYSVGTLAWFVYAAAFLALIFGLLPGLFWLAVKGGQRISRSSVPLKTAFPAFATALVPLGLMFWMAFSLSFVLTNASYILAALSDPFGWGWNLFGTAAIAWQPYLTSALIPMQTLALAGGLLWTLRTSQKVTLENGISPIPVAIFSVVTTFVMLGLLL
jgi:polyferredoxin